MMIHFRPFLLAALLLAGCAGVESNDDIGDTAIMEAAILWRAERDPVSWSPVEMEQALLDEERYEPSGNFYKVNEPLIVFGHDALYVGTLGVEMVPGPNAVVRGSAASVAGAITEKHKIEFTQQAQNFVAELDEYVKLIVAPHPRIEGATIVIGGYFGP